VRTTELQAGQANSIVPAGGWLATPDCWLLAADPWLGATTVIGAGMITTVPQLGHLPFFPAAASGVRTSCRHVGQGNSMAMMS
jgi:hypothetical protein